MALDQSKPFLSRAPSNGPNLAAKIAAVLAASSLLIALIAACTGQQLHRVSDLQKLTLLEPRMGQILSFPYIGDTEDTDAALREAARIPAAVHEDADGNIFYGNANPYFGRGLAPVDPLIHAEVASILGVHYGGAGGGDGGDGGDIIYFGDDGFVGDEGDGDGEAAAGGHGRAGRVGRGDGAFGRYGRLQGEGRPPSVEWAAGPGDARRRASLYLWEPSMEGTYLPARPELTGEGTKKINLIGPPFAHAATDETNLGGIPGDAPANVLQGY